MRRTALAALMAAAILGTAMGGAEAAGQGEAAAQTVAAAETGYVPVNGLNMYYEVRGEGQPTVVLHGAYMSADSMGPFIATLAKTRKVIAMDLQGHGRTGDIDRPITYEQMADDVAALMDTLGVTQADVSAIRWAAASPTSWRSVIRKRCAGWRPASATYKSERHVSAN